MFDTLAIFAPFLLTGLLLPRWQAVCKKVYKTPPHKKGPVGGGWLLAGVVALTLFGLTFIPPVHFPPHLSMPIIAQFSLISLIAIILASFYRNADKTLIAPSRFVRMMPFVFAGIGAFFMPPLLDGMGFWPERALYVVIWLVIMRAFSKADQLDGLAVTSAAIICFALALFVKPLTIPAMVVAGSCLGFLRFNRPDAILLLGSAGRRWLGFIVGGLWLQAASAAPSDGQIFALLILLMPLLVNNLFTTKPWHVRLEALGLSQKQVLARLIVAQIVALFIAVVVFVSPAPGLFLALTFVLAMLYLAYIRWLERC